MVPRGDDPDGLGPLKERDRILRNQFVEACQIWSLTKETSERFAEER